MVKRLLLSAFVVVMVFSHAPATAIAGESSAPRQESSDYDAYKIIVEFHSWATEADKLFFSKRFKLQQIRQYKSNTNLRLYELPVSITVDQLMSVLENEPEINHVSPDYPLDLNSLATIPNDPLYPQQWGLNNTGQDIKGVPGTVDIDIDAAQAWDIQTGDGSCTLAIIDNGIDYTHEDLAANMWINPGEIAGDGIDNDANGYVDDIHGWDFADDDADPKGPGFHGTAVAGIAGAVGNNGKGMTGVAWDVKLMALKIFSDNPANPTTLSMLILALDYAVENGARVSNHSYTIGSTLFPSLKTAIDEAGQNGHLVIAAAGNDATDNDITPVYPSSFTSDNILAVTSVDNLGDLAAGSNYGAQSVDLAAPGRFNYVTFPGDLYTQNLAVTSFAAPMVSGAACLIAMQYPALTTLQLRDRILNGVKPLASMNGITATGGMLNLNNSLFPEPVEDYNCDYFVLKSTVICL